MKRASDRELVDQFLEELGEISLREAEAASGLDFTTVQRFRARTWTRLLPATRRKMIAFLVSRGRQVQDVFGGGAIDLRSANALIAAFDHPAVQGFLVDPSPDAVVRAAFAWAGVNRFSDSEMGKLRLWADRKLGVEVT